MSGNKERKLKVEDLENRVAPMGLVLVPSDPDPNQNPGTPSSGGNTGGVGAFKAAKDQPGRSDTHRTKMYRN